MCNHDIDPIHNGFPSTPWTLRGYQNQEMQMRRSETTELSLLPSSKRNDCVYRTHLLPLADRRSRQGPSRSFFRGIRSSGSMPRQFRVNGEPSSSEWILIKSFRQMEIWRLEKRVGAPVWNFRNCSNKLTRVFIVLCFGFFFPFFTYLHNYA